MSILFSFLRYRLLFTALAFRNFMFLNSLENCFLDRADKYSIGFLTIWQFFLLLVIFIFY